MDGPPASGLLDGYKDFYPPGSGLQHHIYPHQNYSARGLQQTPLQDRPGHVMSNQTFPAAACQQQQPHSQYQQSQGREPTDRTPPSVSTPANTWSNVWRPTSKSTPQCTGLGVPPPQPPFSLATSYSSSQIPPAAFNVSSAAGLQANPYGTPVFQTNLLEPTHRQAQSASGSGDSPCGSSGLDGDNGVAAGGRPYFQHGPASPDFGGNNAHRTSVTGQQSYGDQRGPGVLTGIAISGLTPGVPVDAQRRFRARQKAQARELEMQVAAKLEQMAKLQSERAELEKKLRVLESVVPVRNEHLNFLSKATAILNHPSHAVHHSDISASVFMPNNWDSPEALERLKSTTPSGFRALWRSFLKETSVLVLGAEAHGPMSGAYDRLGVLVLQAMDVFDKVILMSPESFTLSQYVNLETGVDEKPSDEFWTSVARALSPGQQQLKDLKSAMDHYQQTLTPVVAERQELGKDLAEAMDNCESSGAIFKADFHNVVEELTAALKKNLLKERAAQMTMSSFLSSSVLTPLQIVKMAACSYPYFPDGLSITSACIKVAEQDARQQKEQAVPGASGSTAPLQTSTDTININRASQSTKHNPHRK